MPNEIGRRSRQRPRPAIPPTGLGRVRCLESYWTPPRVRNGQPATTELVVRYQDDGVGLPILVILSNYSVRQFKYRDADTYRVEEYPAPDGRAFMLHRTDEAIAADGPAGDPFYGVFVAANGQDHLCTCRGHAAHGRCKHHDAVRSVLAAGHIDRPGADRPAGPVPAVAPF
jgi:hypothetical protein